MAETPDFTFDMRHARICTLAAAMLKMDSPTEVIDAAIETAFRIDARVAERIRDGR